jgi:hypothetical protein
MRIRRELNRTQSELLERLTIINKLGLLANEAELEKLNKGTGCYLNLWKPFFARNVKFPLL